jgi:aldose 1-epimerase
MAIEKMPFGTLTSGEEASCHVLRRGPFTAAFSDYGATWLSFLVPTRGSRGGVEDLLLGYDSLEGYIGSEAYFGATVGRYANRIAHARFSLDGREYRLAANNGANHLHGGSRGFDRRIWKTEASETAEGPSLRYTLVSEDGEEGYPGRLEASTTYSLSEDGRVHITWEARSDARTIVGLTQHAYFNLAGDGRGDILGHELWLAASGYLPVDGGLIPTGGPVGVSGTAFDFRTPKPVGRDIVAAGDYDHCFVIDRAGAGHDVLVECAELRHSESGRSLKVATTMPGIQLYTGNYLGGITGKGGRAYRKHSGLCLETEFFPDSPNRPDFPSCVLDPGATWHHEALYSFGI